MVNEFMDKCLQKVNSPQSFIDVYFAIRKTNAVSLFAPEFSSYYPYSFFGSLWRLLAFRLRFVFFPHRTCLSASGTRLGSCLSFDSLAIKHFALFARH
jgi:hypothetical protein